MPLYRPSPIYLLALAVLLAALGCNLQTQIPTAGTPVSTFPGFTPPAEEATADPYLPATRADWQPIMTPTPDAAHTVGSLRSNAVQHVVQWGETLGTIAQQYEVSVEVLMAANGIANPNLLYIGQTLLIPAPVPGTPGPSFKIIPDSELVAGPVTAVFDIAGFIEHHGGYLASYSEEVDGVPRNGIQIVEEISRDYSVNPRLLLAVLEYQSGWVTQSNPRAETLEHPMGVRDGWRPGLYRQLMWAADNLNRGYYLWRVEAAEGWLTTDGIVVQVDPTINAGTAGVQHMFAGILNEAAWHVAVSESGVFATYQALFGYPFDLAYEPLIPPDLGQPTLQLPFEEGVSWVFTGGPHSAWGDYSAWAALDFAPPDDRLGCVQNNEWVVAVADGVITRADKGRVVQDLDGDGREQTGWSILYMHVESRERVQVGDYVKAGERIGHASCEGGISTGTHLHVARRYNGEWISADGPLPFVMDGWVSVGGGVPYNGHMQRGERWVAACQCREAANMLSR